MPNFKIQRGKAALPTFRRPCSLTYSYVLKGFEQNFTDENWQQFSKI